MAGHHVAISHERAQAARGLPARVASAAPRPCARSASASVPLFLLCPAAVMARRAFLFRRQQIRQPSHADTHPARIVPRHAPCRKRTLFVVAEVEVGDREG